LQVNYSKVEVEENEAKQCKEKNHWIKPPLGGLGVKKLEEKNKYSIRIKIK
jgi:hypothetical protein